MFIMILFFLYYISNYKNFIYYDIIYKLVLILLLPNKCIWIMTVVYLRIFYKGSMKYLYHSKAVMENWE
jgi:hypothetical protein